MNKQTLANRYVLEEIVGEGSYSIVFRGFDREKNREVAIKELKTSGTTKEESDEAEQLFFNEMNILKTLDHPGIPKVYDFFIFQGRYFMVMQRVEGKNLLSILENKGRLLQSEALDYMEQILGILLYLQCNDRKIIYKDLKPSNIILGRNGKIRIIDFGTARFYSPEKKKDTRILGIPGYAPPEAYTGKQTDFSADIYSLGATFYHLTTGEEPFQFRFNFPSPRRFNTELSEGFSRLLLECLKPGDDRIADARQFREFLTVVKYRFPDIFGTKIFDENNLSSWRKRIAPFPIHYIFDSVKFLILTIFLFLSSWIIMFYFRDWWTTHEFEVYFFIVPFSFFIINMIVHLVFLILGKKSGRLSICKISLFIYLFGFLLFLIVSSMNSYICVDKHHMLF